MISPMRATGLGVRPQHTRRAATPSGALESARRGSVHRLQSVTFVRHTLYIFMTALAGCAIEPEPEPPVIDECPTTGRYMELRTGASWTYSIDGEDEKRQTVGALEDVGGEKAGVQAFRVETEKAGGSVVSWQEDTGDAILRHRETDMAGSTATDEIYEPYRTRISELGAHLEPGATWSEEYVEYLTDLDTGETSTVDKVEHWEVVAVDTPVRVPAGDFCALQVRRTSTVGGSDGSDKTYWFARGVGKIKEVGEDRTEELVDWN
jgi:hypothetical protein